ncbi:ABC peptide transporter, membrane subunit [Gulosibacter sp. 10]|nr:ABC peptide transporter, membrane subunit [Gulosibacter sp. 10]
MCFVLVTIAALSVAVFWATEVLPGDAAGVISGPDATQAQREAVRESLGLDRPAAERYGEWILGALRGDLGASLISGRNVAGIVAGRLLTSLAVLIPAAVLILLFAGVLGTIAGMRAGTRLDRALTGAALGVVSVPDFLIATALLLVFGVWLPIFPVVAVVPLGDGLWQHPELIALPCLALAVGGFGSTMRLLRACVAQVNGTPYVEFARLNGVAGARLARLVLTNAAGPAVQAFAVMIAGLLGGAIVVETLFNVPGLGYELTRAVANRDVPLVQGIGLALGTSALLVLLAGDVVARQLGSRSAEEGMRR